jgi:ribosomal protein S18 acetylase RimI-like enzyme
MNFLQAIGFLPVRPLEAANDRLQHAGDCSIYKLDCDICDCGALRHRVGTAKDTPAEIWEQWAAHQAALDRSTSPHLRSTKLSKLLTQFSLRLRPARIEDLAEIKEIKIQAFKELCPNLVEWYAKNPDAFAEEFNGHQGQDPARHQMLVITRNGKVVGCGGLMQKDPIKEPNTGELADIYLASDLRGKGLGYGLVEELLTYTIDFQFDQVFLTTRQEFEAAVRLYTKFGFAPVPNAKYPGSVNSLAFLKKKPVKSTITAIQQLFPEAEKSN